LDEGLVEIPADVLGVVLLEDLAVQRAQLQRADRPAGLLLDPADDLADQSATNGIGLEKNERALAHEGAPCHVYTVTPRLPCRCAGPGPTLLSFPPWGFVAVAPAAGWGCLSAAVPALHGSAATVRPLPT